MIHLSWGICQREGGGIRGEECEKKEGVGKKKPE